MSLATDIGCASFTGVRERNDDAVGYAGPLPGAARMRGILAAVADGVSSSPRGWMAAQISILSLLDDYFSTPAAWEPSAAIDRVMQSINSWIFSQNQRDSNNGMETTLTAVLITARRLLVAHAGDSRCYLLRGGQLLPLTTDHVRSGSGISDALTRTVGGDARLVLDYRHALLEAGDTVLLVTDGIWGSVRDKEMATIMKEADGAQAAVDELCAAARKRGTQDNGSALVIRVLELDVDSFEGLSAQVQALPWPAKLKEQAVLDGLTLEHRLSDNGFTQVWRAVPVGGGEPVLFKTLSSPAGGQPGRLSLVREAWLSQTLQMEALPQSLEPLQEPTAFYCLYRWIAGPTLRELVDRSPHVTIDEWKRLARSLIRTLGALHRSGVVHRDIKPENMIEWAPGKMKLIDLGAAQTRSAVLNTGFQREGTPSYMNPEQWEGAPADEDSDLFALGVTLFELLTGRLPYGPILPGQTGRYLRPPGRVSILRPDAPMWLANWLLKSVASTRDERFQTAEEMMLWLDSGETSGSSPHREDVPLLFRNRLATTRLLLWISVLFNIGLLLALIVLGK